MQIFFEGCAVSRQRGLQQPRSAFATANMRVTPSVQRTVAA
jgi:hypothetical protein